MDPEKVLQAEKQAAADRVLIPSSYAINCAFFAIYLNSMARRCYCSSYRSTNNWFDDLIQIIPISLLFTVCCMYGWAFGLPENFGSGFSGFRNFGFPKMLPEIWLEKEEPENSGTRKFGFGFGFYPNYPKFWNSTYAV